MVQITIDEGLLSKLNAAGEPNEFLDSSGHPVGHFIPFVKRRPTNINPFTPEELADMRQAEAGSPSASLEEIWKRLGAK